MLQNALGEVFADLSNKSPELQDEFLYNADTQKALVKGGEQLIGALNFFVSSVNTLCNKTMEDTIDTVRRYESARFDFEKLLRVLLSRTLDFGNGTVVGWVRLSEHQVPSRSVRHLGWVDFDLTFTNIALFAFFSTLRITQVRS